MAHALVVGTDPAVLQALQAAGAHADIVATADEALARVREDGAVDLVVGDPDELRALLDPLGLGAGPAIAAPGNARELRLELALARARRRAREADAALAVQAREHAAAGAAAQTELLARLARASALRDDNTEEHNARVGETAAALAAALGEPPEAVEAIRAAAPLHDVGKIAIPDDILLKPGRLSEEQFAVVRTHAAIGARILAGSSSPVVRTAEVIARSHHERWDGSGYPDALAGEAIPLPGRIVAVADVFDVLLHERPYKDSWTPEQARAELRRAAGAQFDPRVVEAFDAL